MGSSSSSLGRGLVAGAAWRLAFAAFLCGVSRRDIHDSVSVHHLPD